MTYEIGDGVRFSCTFSDAINGGLVDPNVVTLSLRMPDGTTPTITPVREATGKYYFDYTTTLAGVHWFRWASTGSFAAASEGAFVVSRSQFNV
jgi:hypothetical protein